MSVDKAQMLAEQEALLKKYSKLILAEELALLAPELADLLVQSLPDSVKPLAIGLEAAILPQVQDAIKKLIEEKLA